MKTKPTTENLDTQIDDYFKQAGNKTCPKSMKRNLYAEIGLGQSTWFTPKLVLMSFSLALVTSLLLQFSKPDNKQQKLALAQKEMQIAMHYMNRVSLKSLSAVSNKGIKPGLIKPLARSYASL